MTTSLCQHCEPASKREQAEKKIIKIAETISSDIDRFQGLFIQIFREEQKKVFFETHTRLTFTFPSRLISS